MYICENVLYNKEVNRHCWLGYKVRHKISLVCKLIDEVDERKLYNILGTKIPAFTVGKIVYRLYKIIAILVEYYKAIDFLTF